MPVRSQNEDLDALDGYADENLLLHLRQVRRLGLDNGWRFVVGLARVRQSRLLVEVPVLQVRESRRDEEILVRADLDVHCGLRQFVLTDFGFVAPVPHEQAPIVRISQGDQEVISRREKHSFDSIFVPLQVLDFTIRGGLFDRNDI